MSTFWAAGVAGIVIWEICYWVGYWVGRTTPKHGAGRTP